MFEKLKSIGPGAMVAAAFIGPGTITTATLAGGSLGFTLLWAVLLSTLACLVLQEMSARLGVAGQLGVGQALRKKISNRELRWAAAALVISAILVGNAAYEAGNITGAVIGFGVVLPGLASWNTIPVLLVGGLAFGLLITGSYRLIERFLIGLVCVMGVVFVAAAMLVAPDWKGLLQGLLLPQVPANHWLMVVGLVGTTVVPYNLFLHASAARQRWKEPGDLPLARLDTMLSVSFGGLITAAILISAAGASAHEGVARFESAADLSRSLQQLFGAAAPIMLACGFLAAGMSSAITAPLAAAFATSEVLGWDEGMSGRRFRAIWMSILIVGIVVAAFGWKPTQVILFAQIANGILLPVVATFLVWIMNDRRIMGNQANSLAGNVLAGLVLVMTIGLATIGILKVTGVL